LAYLDFQGFPDAQVELVSDFKEGLERLRTQPDSFLVQCSSHPDVHVVTESYPQEIFVVDTFMFPAKEMGLIVRNDVAEPKSLGVVAAAMGYTELAKWETVVEEPANPIVAENLLAGKYDAGVTFVAFGEAHPDRLSVVERYGEVDTTWLVYGHRRRYRGQLIGHRIPWLFEGAPDPESTVRIPGPMSSGRAA
jgi:hypothetical protein